MSKTPHPLSKEEYQELARLFVDNGTFRSRKEALEELTELTYAAKFDHDGWTDEYIGDLFVLQQSLPWEPAEQGVNVYPPVVVIRGSEGELVLLKDDEKTVEAALQKLEARSG